jgi:hypothetical protein
MFMASTVFLLLTLLLQPQPEPQKRGELWREESQAAMAANAGTDDRRRVEVLSRFHADFPESSRILRNLAWAELRAGNTAGAVELLRQYAETGATLPRGGPIYAATSSAGLLAKIPQLQQNEAEVRRGEKLFQLPDPDLLVEDIAFDPNTGRYLLTSVRKKKIVSCDKAGNCRDVVVSSRATQLDAMLAIYVDAARNVLWATTAGMHIQEQFNSERDGHSALLKFDLKTFHLLRSYKPSDGKPHALGDMTVAGNGDVYVSDGLSGDVYVAAHNSDKLEPLVSSGVFVSPQTPALDKSESVLYVPDYAEGIAAIDLANRKVEWMRAARPLAVEGIDGLYWTDAGLIATQNGTSPERVVRFHQRDRNTLDSFDTLEANWPGLGDPTHAAVVNSTLYFIVNSGWDRVSEDESKFQPGAPAELWRLTF